MKDKIKFTVDFIEEHTNLENVGAYLTAMLELDAFFLNEDRHTNNIAFIRNDDTEEFSLCPYFDFGLSNLSKINIVIGYEITTTGAIQFALKQFV